MTEKNIVTTNTIAKLIFLIILFFLQNEGAVINKFAFMMN